MAPQDSVPVVTANRVISVDVENVAQAWLSLLKARGVDCLFGNPGTEFTAIIDGLQRLGDGAPRPITVPHEFTAVSMAHGYYEMTGRAQAVMVHVTVGAANALGALMDAMHLRVPVLFCAGRTPITERGHAASRDKFIHWAQEMFDQGGMVREAVKWDYELREASTLEAVVDRALSVACSEPRGPVYLMLPRERLMESLHGFQYHARTRQSAASPPAPDGAALRTAVEWLASAERPLIVTNRLGSDREAVALLSDLSERCALPVVTPNAHYMNMTVSHPMWAGYGGTGTFAQADCVLVLDVDVPWCPLDAGPSEEARVIQVGADPLFSRIPMRSHGGDLSITAQPRALLTALLEALPSELPSSRLQQRRLVLQKERAARAAALEASVDSVSRKRPIVPLWVSECLARVWDDRKVLINELSLPVDPIPFARPASYFRASSASGLGWGLGAALGIGLAAPDRIPIAVVGDGAYLFANPPVAHWVSRAYGVPFLTVVLNNGGMSSIRGAVERHFPKMKGVECAFTSLSPSLDFCRLVESAGGHGERIDDPAALPDALSRALRVVEHERRQALIDVICG